MKRTARTHRQVTPKFILDDLPQGREAALHEIRRRFTEAFDSVITDPVKRAEFEAGADAVMEQYLPKKL